MIRFRHILRGLGADEAGIASLQFALIVPTFLLVYFGVISTFELSRADRQATNSAVVLADLTTRRFEMTDDARNGLFNTASALLDRFQGDSSADFSITAIINPVSGGDAPDDGDPQSEYEVFWSTGTASGVALSTADLARFDIPVIDEGESLILIEVSGVFKPTIGAGVLGLPMETTIRTSAIRKPRFVTVLNYPGFTEDDFS